MESLLLLLSALLLAGTASSHYIPSASYQYIPYEHMLVQLQGCPKECHCSPHFPTAVYCDNRALKTVPIIPPYTWYLYLQGNGIEVLSEHAFLNATQLRWINMNRNSLTNEGLQAGAFRWMSNLVYLFMEDNQLTSVPSPLPPNLEQLRLSRNHISKIPEGVFSGMHRLTLLDLQGNKLQDGEVTEVSLNGLTNLLQINLAENQLTRMPLGLPPTMAQIYLDNNNIDMIPVEYFKSLPRVAFLWLSNNKLSSEGIPKYIFNISSILDLQLSYNELTEIPHIPANLEQLHLDHNKIKSVSASDICPMPVAFDDYYYVKSPRLRYLRLDGNEIQPPIPRDLMICFRLLSAVVI